MLTENARLLNVAALLMWVLTVATWITDGGFLAREFVELQSRDLSRSARFLRTLECLENKMTFI